MPVCTICEEPLAEDAKSCPHCGTVVDMFTSGPTESSVYPSEELEIGFDEPSAPQHESPDSTSASASGERQCPECHKTYDAEYDDDFCDCGAELQSGISSEQSSSVLAQPAAPTRPASGTVCLVVYSADKQPVYYHTLDGDVTMVGRCDPVRGDFPDLDLAKLFDEPVAKSVSRKHALVLRSRETGAFALRPMEGNTGTQVERDMATELEDHPLVDGTRIILGGQVRLKFEVIQ